jgi:hypothetical protein
MQAIRPFEPRSVTPKDAGSSPVAPVALARSLRASRMRPGLVGSRDCFGWATDRPLEVRCSRLGFNRYNVKPGIDEEGHRLEGAHGD